MSLNIFPALMTLQLNRIECLSLARLSSSADYFLSKNKVLLFGLALGLTCKFCTMLKIMKRDKHASLFVQRISDRDKKSFKINAPCYETLFFANDILVICYSVPSAVDTSSSDKTL